MPGITWGVISKWLALSSAGLLAVLALEVTPALAGVVRGASAATPPTWAPGCNGEPYGWSQRPATVELTCDSVANITGLHWHNWGRATAQALGTLNAATGCTPNCAEAPRRHFAVRVLASNVGYCGARRVYATIAVHYLGAQAHRLKTITQPTFCSLGGARPKRTPPGPAHPSKVLGDGVECTVAPTGEGFQITPQEVIEVA